MAIEPSILRAMQAAGASIDVIIAAVEADAALESERVEARRAKDAERQRRHRASRDVTVTERDSTDSVTDPLSLPPNEKISNPPTHTPGIKTPARKGLRLPVDWQPKALPAELAKAVATWPSGAIERELARFRDWAASATGPNAVKSDWDAAWRNWLRKVEDEGRYRERSTQTASRSIDRRDGVAVALDRRLGLDQSPGSVGRHDAGESGSYRALPAPRIAAVR